MTSDELIKEVEDKWAEWIEMSQDPGYFVARVLAYEYSKLVDYLDFLEKVIDDVHNERRVK